MKPNVLIVTIFLPLMLGGCADPKPDAAPSAPQPDASPAAQHIVLTAEQLRAAQIGIARAGPAKLRETLPLQGIVAPNAERVREVVARFAGPIRSVSHAVGDTVGAGETLATVESNESLQTYPVTAPIAGIVAGRHANVGEQAGEKALFVVVDLSSVWVELSLFPRDASKIRVGQHVRVTSADGDYSAEGRLTHIGPFGSSSSQTLTARVLLPNPQQRWTPGLYVTAEVTLAESPLPLVIQRSALQHVADSPVVFVQTDAGFQLRAVKTGRNDSTMVEVLEGLQAGDTYATTNSYVLKAEALKNEAAEE